MDQSTVSEVKSYNSPPEGVHETMIATYMILGYPEQHLVVSIYVPCSTKYLPDMPILWYSNFAVNKDMMSKYGQMGIQLARERARYQNILVFS